MIVKITEVKPNPKNPRIIKDDKFQKLVNSIKEFPEMLEKRPLVCYTDVDKKLVILGGNMRYKAAKELGIKELTVVLADEWTEEQKAQFLIKDNLGYGEWDWEIIANEWDAEKLNEWGMDIPDFKGTEIEAVEDDYEIPEEIKSDIVLGDLVEIGQHRLLCGDSTEVDNWQKVMKDKLADLIITDPPYNVDYSSKNKMLNYADKGNRNQNDIENDKMDNDSFYQFLYDFYISLGSYTKTGGSWYVWHADSEGINFRTAFTNSGLSLKQCLIWVKNNMVLGRQDYQWKHEPCLYGWKEGAAHYFTSERTHTTVIEDTINVNKLTKDQMKKMLNEILSDKTKSTIIHCDKPHRSAEHPTMKPILLLAPLIENSSRVGEIVADGFLGSGSTMVASHQLNRKCYGMELDPKYCQVIVDRMMKLDPSLEVKINGKPYVKNINNKEVN